MGAERNSVSIEVGPAGNSTQSLTRVQKRVKLSFGSIDNNLWFIDEYLMSCIQIFNEIHDVCALLFVFSDKGAKYASRGPSEAQGL